MKTDEILERLDTLGKMLYEKFGTDSYEARCYLHDTKELIKKRQSLPIDSVSGSLISAEYLKGLHPELTLKECESLKAFSNNKTIYHKDCYGDGSIMYPKWKAEN